MSAIKPATFNDIMQGPILRAIHDWNFKGGVFKSSITKDTSIPDSISILISSPHLSAAEKESASAFLSKYYLIREKYPGDDFDTITKACELSKEVMGGDGNGLMTMFKDDAKARGDHTDATSTEKKTKNELLRWAIVWNEEKQSFVNYGGPGPRAPEEYLKRATEYHLAQQNQEESDGSAGEKSQEAGVNGETRFGDGDAKISGGGSH